MEKQNKNGLGIHSIRVRLIVMILACSIIPLTIMTLLNTNSIKNTVQELQTEIAVEKAMTAKQQVLALVDQTMLGVDVLAKDSTLIKALQSPTPANIAEAKKTLKSVQSAFPAGETITFVYGTDGKQIVRADDNELGDVSDRPYAQFSLQGQKFVSEVSISRVTGRASVFMADPIYDERGQIIGGIAKVAELASLNDSIAALADANTDIMVLDRAGTLVASTEDVYDLGSGELINLSSETYYAEAQKGVATTRVLEHNGNTVLATFIQEDNTSWVIACFTDFDYVERPYHQSLMMALMILLIAVIVIIIVGYFFSGSIAKPIILVEKFAKTLASGDFTTDSLKVSRKDEIGAMSASLNEMFENNLTMIQSIGAGSDHVSESSAQLSENSKELKQKFEQVAAAMERVNDAMTSTGAATEEVAASANEVNNSVEKLAKETDTTKEEVIQITKKAAEIEKEGRESSERAIAIAEQRSRELEEAAQAAKVVSEIGSMADSIAEIASQINLLSLNASIEAARAGEHGRGFAVVAGEINKLATETKDAVDQIQTTVAKIQEAFSTLESSSMDLLNFMRETVAPDYQKFITIGQEYGNDASTFGQLADNIAEMVGYISAMMEQVNQAVNEIAQSATNTATSSSEVMDTIGSASQMMETMNEMADNSQVVALQLDGIVRKFKF